MAYTELQQLRRARAKNKGSNKRVASMLRRVALILDRRGPDELRRQEISALQAVREAITARLYENACTKALQLVIKGQYKIVDGKHEIALNPRDL